jgi:hypothetical protein
MAGFRLPTQGSKARAACGDMVALAEILDRANIGKLPDTVQARKEAVAALVGTPPGTRINVVVLRASDQRWLISVGKLGGWRRVWNFGNGRD